MLLRRGTRLTKAPTCHQRRGSDHVRYTRQTPTRLASPIRFLRLATLDWGRAVCWGQTTFINEIHYDNIGKDTGEAIEVARASRDRSFRLGTCALQWEE